MSEARVVVRAAGPAFEGRARTVAGELGLAYAGDCPDADLALVLDERGWGLLDLSPGAPGVVRADLAGGPLGRRLRAGIGREERLAKAMALRSQPRPRVVDATAGLGRDSAVAAALGCEVLACERSPVVALLLRDALERAAAADLGAIASRITLRVADARDVLASLAEDERPDVVILDPMFPERVKPAKVKKEMQVLHRLLGPEPAVGALLETAWRAARRRVVVKRPAHAPPVNGRRPDIVVPGRTARYDVYVVSPAGGSMRA